MPGKTPYEAFSAFVEPLAGALNCVSQVRFEVTEGGKNQLGKVHGLFLTGTKINDGYVPLKGAARRLEFRARMLYEIIKDDRETYGPLRVTTKAYDYSLRTADHQGVFDYHWHPTGLSHESRPHVHIGAAQLRTDAVLAAKDHIPTGRITLEAVVRQAIAVGAEPLLKGWEDRLAASEGPHILFRSWQMDHDREVRARQAQR